MWMSVYSKRWHIIIHTFVGLWTQHYNHMPLFPFDLESLTIAMNNIPLIRSLQALHFPETILGHFKD